MTTTFKFITVLAAIMFAALAIILITQSNQALGSTIQGQEYIATTTGNAASYGVTVTTSRLIKGGYGGLGSVVVTGANTGVMNFYDATTTDVTARTGNKATSTILIASIPASLVAGTYVFDVAYGQGLYLDIVSGVAPTSTITYR